MEEVEVSVIHREGFCLCLGKDPSIWREPITSTKNTEKLHQCDRLPLCPEEKLPGFGTVAGMSCKYSLFSAFWTQERRTLLDHSFGVGAITSFDP